ncbi:hypothetical protein V6N13_022849 [Hibiscus sabdariffa]
MEHHHHGRTITKTTLSGVTSLAESTRQPFKESPSVEPSPMNGFLTIRPPFHSRTINNWPPWNTITMAEPSQRPPFLESPPLPNQQGNPSRSHRQSNHHQ